MPMIPRKIYRLCERQLLARYNLIASANERLKEARAMAYSVAAQALDAQGGSHGSGRGDGLERKAIAVVEARQALKDALAWDDVIHRLERLFPDGTMEARVAGYLYGWTTGTPVTQEDVCRILRRNRQTVRRYRDTYVTNCALLAAEAGLITIEEDGCDGNL